MGDHERDWDLQESIRQIKVLILLGQNFRFPGWPGNRMKCLRFLCEFQIFHDEHGDTHVPPKLRELVKANEDALSMTRHVYFEKDCYNYIIAKTEG